MRKRNLPWFAGTLLLSACGGSGAQDAVDVSAKMPPIHVVQVAELLDGGGNAARAAYAQTLQACQAAGLPTTPLSSQDEAKVGKTRYEIWFAPDLEVVREETWDVDIDQPGVSCHFSLRYEGSQETTDATHYETVDLGTGQVDRGQAQDGALERIAADPADLQPPEGVTGPHRRQVAGQPCNEWVSEGLGNRQCVWAGGAEWGFSPGTDNADYRPSRSLIVLEQAPLGDSGLRLTTEQMTVGEAFARPRLPAPVSREAGR